jgi:hypothetical protein
VQMLVVSWPFGYIHKAEPGMEAVGLDDWSSGNIYCYCYTLEADGYPANTAPWKQNAAVVQHSLEQNEPGQLVQPAHVACLMPQPAAAVVFQEREIGLRS